MTDQEIITKCRALLDKIGAEYADKKTKPAFFYELIFLQGVMAGIESTHAKKQTSSEGA